MRGETNITSVVMGGVLKTWELINGNVTNNTIQALTGYKEYLVEMHYVSSPVNMIVNSIIVVDTSYNIDLKFILSNNTQIEVSWDHTNNKWKTNDANAVVRIYGRYPT